jgi:hypothetical protein
MDRLAFSDPALNMARPLVVVSRQHADLYVYLSDRFARERETELEIILDRRLGERRRQSVSVSVERRRTDRRSRPAVDAQLRERSHVVVSAG